MGGWCCIKQRKEPTNIISVVHLFRALKELVTSFFNLVAACEEHQNVTWKMS